MLDVWDTSKNINLCKFYAMLTFYAILCNALNNDKSHLSLTFKLILMIFKNFNTFGNKWHNQIIYSGC